MRIVSRSFARRCIALLVLFAGIAAGYLVIVAPLIADYNTRANEIADARVLLGRYQAVTRGQHRQGSGKDAPDTDKQNNFIFLHGESDSLILAQLQSRLKNLAATNGAQFQGARSLPVRNEDQLRFLGVRLTVSGSTKSLRDLMHAIESGVPYLIIEGAHIRQKRRNVSLPVQAPAHLVAQLDVVGAINAVKMP